MKYIKYIILFLLLSMIMNTSCRKEEMEIIEPDEEETLERDSDVAELLLRVAMHDGSVDNIIDQANCFSIQLPIDVVANGVQLTIASEADYQAIEDLFDASENDSDYVTPIFPVTIIYPNYTTATVSSSAELSSLAANCNGENEPDDDIECVDFVYPIVSQRFNTTTEELETITLDSDEELYYYVDGIQSVEVVTVTFPITVSLSDFTLITTQTFNELQTTITSFSNDCDEDDDFDYNDDDCIGCTANQLSDLLTSCTDWEVDKLERNGNDYDEVYAGYFFNFFENGTMEVDDFGDTHYGTWETDGTGDNITILIEIPSLPLCNLNWSLHSIEDGGGETKVDLRVGGDDRMRYVNNCN